MKIVAVLFDIQLKDDLEVNVVGGFIVLVFDLLFAKVWKDGIIQRWLVYRLLPINQDFVKGEKNRERFKAYHASISNKIIKLLPDELKGAWEEKGDKTNQNMIKLRAEEIDSLSTRSKSTGRIKDLMKFLDSEFFFIPKTNVNPITIQGEPGSGKSTLIFEVYRQQANRLQHWGHGWIPLLVFAHEFSWELLKKQKTFKDFLQEYFRFCYRYHSAEGYNEIADLIKEHYGRYRFFIIIDGLDEIPDRRHYEEMNNKLKSLLDEEVKNDKGNRYLITCRTDDDQRTVDSRRLSLLPLEQRDVKENLGKLKKYYKKHNQPKYLERVQRILDGLQKARVHRLLQNYIRNPYLFFLIREYYGGISEPLAKNLTMVYEYILEKELERELGKPRDSYEKEVLIKERQELSKYLKSLISPYCYKTMIDGLARNSFEGEPSQLDFRRYIEVDEQMSKILLGRNNEAGYLKAVHDQGKDDRRKEQLYHSLCKLWGENKAEIFGNY